MAIRSSERRIPGPAAPSRPPRLHKLAAQPQWSLTEYVCTSGPQDHPFEERHDWVSVALVTEGTFRYRTDSGEGMLYPGAFLLGNAGACYECGHEHSAGDRCLALHVSHDLFTEIAASVTGSHRFRFRTAVLPAIAALAPVTVSLKEAPGSARLALEETVLNLLDMVVRTAGASRPQTRRPRPGAVRRLAAVFEYIDTHSASDLDLAQLSMLAAMSKYHFLRTFRRVSGMTPYQYLLGCRVRSAAHTLWTTRAPVGRIALDHGCGDLSTFNHMFRRVMGLTPTKFRSRGRRRSLTP